MAKLQAKAEEKAKTKADAKAQAKVAAGWWDDEGLGVRGGWSGVEG